MWLSLTRTIRRVGFGLRMFGGIGLRRGYKGVNEEEEGEYDDLSTEDNFGAKNNKSGIMYQRPWIILTETELNVYKGMFNSSEMELLKSMIQGRALSSFNKSDILEVSNKLAIIDISMAPIRHLFCLMKWVGTSPLRKYDFRLSSKLALTIYNQLKTRGALDEFLLIKEDVSDDLKFDPRRSKPIEQDTPEWQESINHMTLIFEKSAQQDDWLSNHLDILVSLSNINIYIHELMMSAKMWLLYTAERVPANDLEDKVIYMSRFRSGNYVWAYIRFGINDQNLYNEVFLKHYSDKDSNTNLLRSLVKAHLMGIQYMLTPPARRTQIHVEAINKQLEKMIEHTSGKQYVFTSKNARMLCQLVLAIYPEVAKHVRNQTFYMAYPNESNPFAKHYRALNKLLVISNWLIHENFKNQSSKRGFNITYFEGDGVFQTSSRSSYLGRSRGFEHKVTQAFLRYCGSDIYLETNAIMGFYEIDMLANDNAVIEINSSTHFVYNTTIPIIAQQIKDMQLELLGATIVKHVNHFEFEQYLAQGPSAIERQVQSIMNEIKEI